MISGSGGLGKSMLSQFMALEMAMDHQKGDINNRLLFDQFEIQKTCTSLFLQSENNINTINTRFNKMCGENPVRREALKNIIMPNINGDILMSGKTLNDKRCIQYIIDLIHKIEDSRKQKIDLVWVDPIISFIDCDENDNVRVRRNLDGFTEIATATATTPAIIHHGKKDGDGYRGASAFRDWCRSHIELKLDFTASERLQADDSGNITGRRTASIPIVKVNHEKSNNFREFETFSLRLKPDLNFKPVTETISPEKAEAGHLLAEIINSDENKTITGLNTLAKEYGDLSGKSPAQAKRDIKESCDNKFIIMTKTQENKRPKYVYTLPE